MTRSRWIIFAVIAIAILGGLVALSNKDRIDVSDVDVNKIVTSGDIPDQVYGNPNAKVVVIEYADFQCPGCGAAFPNFNSVKEAYKDQVAFVFRNFPLTTIHPNALVASSVAEAAGEQNKFWEMHDLLFENQNSWKDLRAEDRGAIFEGYASQLNLNVDQFNADLGGEKVSYKIAYDRALGGKAGVSSTPTFYINGQELSQESTLDIIQGTGELLKKDLDAAIKKAGGTPPAATTGQ